MRWLCQQKGTGTRSGCPCRCNSFRGTSSAVPLPVPSTGSPGSARTRSVTPLSDGASRAYRARSLVDASADGQRVVPMATLKDRFEAKLDRSGEHRVWLGAKRPDGTGKVTVAGESVTAQRVAWELARSPVPPGVGVVACADERSCVRVEHLSLRGRRWRTTDPGAHGGGGATPANGRHRGRCRVGHQSAGIGRRSW